MVTAPARSARCWGLENCPSTRPRIPSKLSLDMRYKTTPRDAADGPIDRSRDPSLERLTVSQAAKRLGVTPDAVRKRIRRGTMEWDTDPDGRVRVYIGPDDGRRDGYRHHDGDASVDASTDASGIVVDGYREAIEAKDEALEDLRDQVAFMRRELERKDAILLRMAERMPELEAPREPRDVPEAASPPSDRGAASESSQEPVERRSWWRRFFGIE